MRKFGVRGYLQLFVILQFASVFGDHGLAISQELRTCSDSVVLQHCLDNSENLSPDHSGSGQPSLRDQLKHEQDRLEFQIQYEKEHPDRMMVWGHWEPNQVQPLETVFQEELRQSKHPDCRTACSNSRRGSPDDDWQKRPAVRLAVAIGVAQI